MDKRHIRFRPCKGRNMSVCIFSFVLSLVFTISGFSIIEAVFTKYIFISLGCVFLLLNILFVVLGLWGFNSVVFLKSDRISQKAFNRPKTIYYNDIDDIKLSNAYYAKVPPLISLCKNKKKISFEITPKILNAFLNLCEDSALKERISKILVDNHIY